MIQIKLITLTFNEDDIMDGAIRYTDSVEEIIECETVEEAADFIKGCGLEFAATGGGWAADPDGSQIVDYRTAEREERSAHLIDCPEAAAARIEELVG